MLFVIIVRKADKLKIETFLFSEKPYWYTIKVIETLIKKS